MTGKNSKNDAHARFGLRLKSGTSHLACLPVAFGLLASGTVHAQTADAGFGMEEIVVTATKRGFAESLQTVPMSIQALTSKTLEQAGAQDFQDFARMAPSISLVQQGTGAPQVSIRGVTVGMIPNTTTQEKPLTSVYYDDLPVSLANFNPNLDLFDIQRVEVLRGPQGTLYGAGAMGGNIRFVSNPADPTQWAAKFEGSLASTRHGGGTYDLKGMVNAPVVEDKFAIRAIGTMHWDDGYIDNSYLGIKDYDNNKRKGARVSALFQPTDKLSITANFLYQDVTFKNGRHSIDLPDLSNPAQNAYGPSPYLDKMKIFNLILEYDLGWASLFSSSAYFDRDITDTNSVQNLMEAYFGLKLDAPNRSIWNNRDFVQEFRLTSSGDHRLNWILGAFYANQKSDYDQDFTLPDASGVLGFPTGGYGAPSDDILFYGVEKTRQKQYAVFGEATYKITDALSFTTGLRWFKWKQDFDLVFAGFFQGAEYLENGKTKTTKVTPKFTLSYKGNEDWMVYATMAKGYRLGGLNEPVPPDLCGADLATSGLTEAPTTFKPDSLWSYEVGAKTEWFERRLKFNATAFYIDWKDVQTRKNLPICSFYFTENVGKVESKGIEFELVAVPAKGLTLSVGGAYTDSTLGKDVPNLFGSEGDRVPYVPKLAISASAEYSHPLTDSLNGYLRFDIQHISERYTEFNRGLAQDLPSYEIGNLHIGIESGNWGLAFFVKNIWDKRAILAADESFSIINRIIERPRTIGITLRANY